MIQSPISTLKEAIEYCEKHPDSEDWELNERINKVYRNLIEVHEILPDGKILYRADLSTYHEMCGA